MPSLTLEARTRISASPDDVWNVLVDFKAYDRWNPRTRITGEPRVGSWLTVGVGPGMRFRARVLVAEPGRELRWLGRLGLGGLADGEHYFRLVPDADGSTSLIHGERYTGLLVALAGKHAHDPSAYEAFNTALKLRVETLASESAAESGPRIGGGARS
jgi:hypothetical protein